MITDFQKTLSLTICLKAITLIFDYFDDGHGHVGF